MEQDSLSPFETNQFTEILYDTEVSAQAVLTKTQVYDLTDELARIVVAYSPGHRLDNFSFGCIALHHFIDLFGELYGNGKIRIPFAQITFEYRCWEAKVKASFTTMQFCNVLNVFLKKHKTDKIPFTLKSICFILRHHCIAHMVKKPTFLSTQIEPHFPGEMTERDSYFGFMYNNGNRELENHTDNVLSVLERDFILAPQRKEAQAKNNLK